MTKTQTLLTIPVLGALMLAGGAVAGYTGLASAATGDATSFRGGMGMMAAHAPHVEGVITGISGTTITITADEHEGGGTYTIDAANAKIMKDGASATLADYVVGDDIFATGTIDGTNVVATVIRNGDKGFGPDGFKGRRGGKGPGVVGTVSSVSGSTLTVTGPDGKSYSVNAEGAVVQKMVAGSLSDIVVGDRIGVQGSVSGTSITAAHIMDDLPEFPQQAQ